MTGIKEIVAGEDVHEARMALVVSKYNSYVVGRLVEGCLATLKNAGIKNDNLELIRVPGAFEIPVAVKNVVNRGGVDAVITLGAVIRGETPHFDIIANECARGIGEIAIQYGVPVVFGVLTVDTVDQAMDRSGDEESNKGSEAAHTALEMVSVLGKLG